MATIYKCDRCDSQTTKREEMRSVQIPVPNGNWSRDRENLSVDKDLCDDCVHQLHEQFGKPLPKAAPVR